MTTKQAVRILYMEDDPGAARLFQKRLEQHGYVIDLASDGQEGLTKYKTGVHDLVVVDQNMPIYDGLQVIHKLAKDGRLPPTIMITGSGSENIAVQAMKLGARDYIVKDVEGGYLELLPSVIEQLLDQERLIRERQEALDALEQRNRDLALLNEVGQALTATLNLEQIIERLLMAATSITSAKSSLVWLWSESQPGWLCCQKVFYRDEDFQRVELTLAPGEGLAGWVGHHGKSAITDAPTPTPGTDTAPIPDVTSVLAVPLRVRDSVIGVLELANKAGGTFTANDQTLVETMASSAAIAIDNARLVETFRQQAIDLKMQNEDLNAFSHSVAHDLKNPLFSIVGSSNLLRQDGLSPEQQMLLLEGIEYGARKMSNIVDELLLLGQVRKIEEVELSPLNMTAIVAEVQQRLAFMIDKYEPEIILPEHWPPVLGHAPWVEEVWVNYLSNAMKYGGQPPRIELGATPLPDGMIRFWIRDNGRGIPTEKQGQLFAPFTRLNQVVVEGHGLGLSIVHRIVKKLGGEIGVESEVGQGSIFSFTLPAPVAVTV
ncbi:MAG: sensor histidine kinase [Aggregatilineales bacterium]